jgi:ABC-type uncharacterized transport system substrate-binding protein
MQFDRLRRREFIALFGGAAVVWPLAARAQPARMRRIGVLTGHSEDDSDAKARLAGFRQGLATLGWADNRNIRIDYRYAAGGADRHQPLAKELTALSPDVILAHGAPSSAALQRESRTIPIVFVGVSDPIGAGLVATLARPGGNFTGLLLYEESITGKWLAMLKEIAPRLTRAALVANPKTTLYDHFLRGAEVAAPSLAIELAPRPIADAADIERLIPDFARMPNGGLVVLPDETNNAHRDLIVALAARHRLPAVYTNRFFVAVGGLMSYGIDAVDMFRQAATLVDRILRGEKPADLPVQAPVKYETVLNLKTAKSLNLEVPSSLLVRADEVIE